MSVNEFYHDLQDYSDNDILLISKMYGLQGDPKQLRWMIATKHSFKQANMLSGGLLSFVEKLPELQKVARAKVDQSFPKIDKNYITELIQLIADQKQFKKNLRGMAVDQKRQEEAVLNRREAEFKNQAEWQKIQEIRDIFGVVPQQYFNWTIKSYINGSINRAEDIPARLKTAILDFEWLKKRGKIDKKENLQQLNGLAGLEKFLNKYNKDLEERRKEVAESEETKEEGKLVYDGKDIKIIHPTTEASACYYGKGTRWCTSATTSQNMFNSYNKEGNLYIVQPKNPGKDGKEKYQLHFEFKQYMNEKDKPVDFHELVQRYPEIIALREYEPKFLLAYYRDDIVNDNVEKIKSLNLTEEEANTIFKSRVECNILKYLFDNYNIPKEDTIVSETINTLLECPDNLFEKYIERAKENRQFNNIKMFMHHDYKDSKVPCDMLKYLIDTTDFPQESSLNYKIMEILVKCSKELFEETVKKVLKNNQRHNMAMISSFLIDNGLKDFFKIAINVGYTPKTIRDKDYISDLEYAINDNQTDILKLIINTLSQDIKMPTNIKNNEIIDILLQRATNKEELLQLRRKISSIDEVYDAIQQNNPQKLRESLDTQFSDRDISRILNKLFEGDVNSELLTVFIKSDIFTGQHLKKFIQDNFGY